MTITEPIPATGYGRGDWVDYQNYWREKDAEWIQDRAILRYADAASIEAIVSPGNGMTVFDEGLGILKLRRAGTWRRYSAIPDGMEARGADTLANLNAGGKGIQFLAGSVDITHDLNVLGGVLTTRATGVGIKVGTKTALLSTDAANLISDTPLSVPGVIISGTGTISAAGKNVTTGALTADSITTAGTLTAGAANVASLTATGNVNGAAGVIGGVTLSGNFIVSPSGMASSYGYFNGDTNGALMRYRNPSNGALSSTYVQATNADINLSSQGGGYVSIFSQGRGVRWYNASNVHDRWVGLVYVGSSDPGGPDGTIWVQP